MQRENVEQLNQNQTKQNLRQQNVFTKKRIKARKSLENKEYKFRIRKRLASKNKLMNK